MPTSQHLPKGNGPHTTYTRTNANRPIAATLTAPTDFLANPSLSTGPPLSSPGGVTAGPLADVGDPVSSCVVVFVGGVPGGGLIVTPPGDDDVGESVEE